MNRQVKRYAIISDNWDYVESPTGGFIDRDDYAALEAENARLQNALLEVTARRFAESWKKRTSDAELEQYLSAGVAQIEAERDALRQQRDKLAQALGSVEREHDLIRQMKNCEIHRGRGSFGIAVMSDPLALDWQALDKELQQIIDARLAALAASTGQEVKP